MTIDELRNILVDRGYRKDMYCLTGGLPSEAFTIDQSLGKWSVYYSERGQKNGQVFFETESEACTNLLNRLEKHA